MSQAQDAEERLRNGESWQGVQRPGLMSIIVAIPTQCPRGHHAGQSSQQGVSH